MLKNNFFSTPSLPRFIISVILFTSISFHDFAIAQIPTPTSFSYFSHDLGLGSKGEEVMRLQQILNSEPQTQVAEQGPGSKGLETGYFGGATLRAVTRFQEINAPDILHPIGLLKGTGFVGQKTREKLNALLVSTLGNNGGSTASNSITLNQPDPTAVGFSGLQSSIFSGSNELFTGFISKYSGLPGMEISLSCSGFTPTDNTVNFGQYKISKLASSNNVITFNVPSNILPGRYDVFVSNKKGRSTDKTFFVVLSSLTLPPKINSISPVSGVYGQEITIHGENFSLKDNEIRSGYGIISGLRSKDGQTITFKVEPFPGALSAENKYNNQEALWPIDFYVVNSNGISEQSGQFLLKI